MNIILLSGGSGKRLWPLSNDTRSKQFLKLLKNEQGDYESMVQRVYGQIKQIDFNANIIVATGITQVDSIKSQLGENVDIVIEPERRDTFPAIALAAAYLANEKKMDLDEVIIVLPVDPYAEIDYFKTLLRMEEAIKDNVADLVLMGIKPSYPSSGYGYIVPVNDDSADRIEKLSSPLIIHKVDRFVEKPAEVEAQDLIERGAVWNGGVFAFHLRYLIDIIEKSINHEKVDITSFASIRNNYELFRKNSFDYEVVEKAESVAMIPYNGYWKDLGTWNTLTEEISEEFMGKVTMGDETENSYVINELPIPIIVLGAKDLVVASSPDGILISSKNKCAGLKTYVDKITERPMYGESLWGDYKVVDYLQYEDETKSLTKHLTIKANRFISYQAHKIRDEILTIVSGAGKLVVDGETREVKRGDAIYISKGQKHAIKAYDDCDLHCIEVQIGKTLAENDYDGFLWEW